MSRPTLEVADLIRAAGDSFIERNRDAPALLRIAEHQPQHSHRAESSHVGRELRVHSDGLTLARSQ